MLQVTIQVYGDWLTLESCGHFRNFQLALRGTWLPLLKVLVNTLIVFDTFTQSQNINLIIAQNKRSEAHQRPLDHSGLFLQPYKAVPCFYKPLVPALIYEFQLMMRDIL